MASTGQREKVRKLRRQWRTLTAVFWLDCECECSVLVINVFKLLVEINYQRTFTNITREK